MQQVVGGSEAINPQPGFSGRRAQQYHRVVVHLVLVIHIERLLGCNGDKYMGS